MGSPMRLRILPAMPLAIWHQLPTAIQHPSAMKLKKLAKLADAFRVDREKDFRLKDYDPADTQGLDLKEQSQALLQESVKRMATLQDMLYAQNEWAVLL